MTDFFFSTLKLLTTIILIFLIPLIISFIGYYIYFRFKQHRRLPKNLSKYKKRSLLKRIYSDFPKQWWLDKYSYKPRRI